MGHVNLHVNRVAARVKVPLVFGEIGYMSRTGGCSHPAGNGLQGALPAPQAQFDAYRALFDAVAKSHVVDGMALWSWNVRSTVADTGFSPKTKPAECLIVQRWSIDATDSQLAAGAAAPGTTPCPAAPR